MPAYYYVVLEHPQDDVVIGRPNPEKAAAGIPDRPTDFPKIPAVPFEEEARLAIISRLYAEWSYATHRPILVRANDDGTLDAWVHYEAVEVE